MLLIRPHLFMQKKNVEQKKKISYNTKSDKGARILHGGHRDRDRMVAWYILIDVISVYRQFYPWVCVVDTTFWDKSVSDLRQVGGFVTVHGYV